MAARLWIITLAWVLAAPAWAQGFFVSGGAQPLDPREAFQMRVLDPEGDTPQLGWTIAPGYYLYRENFEAKGAQGQPLTVETRPGKIKDDPVFGRVEVYYDSARIALPGASGPVEITWQGCQEDGICYQPVTETVELPAIAAPSAKTGTTGPDATYANLGKPGPANLTSTNQDGANPDAATPGATAPDAMTTDATVPDARATPGLTLERDSGLGGLAAKGTGWVLLAYLGFGLLLAFTPCTFPMLPILLGMLTRRGETLRPARGAALSGVYVLAMASAFAVMGAFAGWSGQNLQIALQSPWAIGTLAVLFVLLALPGLGLFQLQLPAAISQRVARMQGRRGSLGGAAALGFGSALIVGPCVTAPLAGALLYIAQSGDVALGAAALFALGLGQGIPLFLAGSFGAALLPKAGPWMARVQPLFAAVFLAMAIWLAGRILPEAATMALWALLLIGLAVHLGALDAAGRPILRTLGVAALVAGLLQAVGAAMGTGDPLRPLAGLGGGGIATATAAPVFASAASVDELNRALANAGDRPAMIYVTADWCVICRGIERNVLTDPQVTAALDGITRIKADLSDPDPALNALMDELGVAGPPTMIFLDRTRHEAPDSRLIGTISAQELLQSVNAASAGAG